MLIKRPLNLSQIRRFHCESGLSECRDASGHQLRAWQIFFVRLTQRPLRVIKGTIPIRFPRQILPLRFTKIELHLALNTLLKSDKFNRGHPAYWLGFQTLPPSTEVCNVLLERDTQICSGALLQL